jgi:uncharacterized protein YaaN involved in tellurite resistance
MTLELTPAVPQPGAAIQAARHLTPDELAQAREIADALDLRDSMAISGFGIKPQAEMSALAEPILKIVAAEQAGAAGAVLSELVDEIRAADADSLAGAVASSLRGVPVLGGLLDRVRGFRSRFERIGAKIDRIVVELEQNRFVLSRDVALLDRLYEQNVKALRGLLVYIAAGELKIAALRDEQRALAESAGRSADPMDALLAADLESATGRLERRVHDLRLATMVALQTAPQIRMVQNGNQLLIEKIHSSIVITIPVWKQQVILALALADQRKAIEAQKGVTQATNAMLVDNAENVRKGALDAAVEAQKGIVQMDTLVHVNEQLIGAIEDAIRIQEEGRRRRHDAEEQLGQLQSQLKTALAQARSGG